jgi:AraC-like DNA-binding protein
MPVPDPEILTVTPPEAAHAHWAIGFVQRWNGRGGHVVYELPELRTTIQMMLADDYWLRDREHLNSWARVPRIALWGPRATWGYGYARAVINAFSFALTPSAVAALTGCSPERFVDRVVDLASLRGDLAEGLAQIVADHPPGAWQRETCALFSRAVKDARPPEGDNGGDAVRLLVTQEADAVRRASSSAGVGPRQFRRRFRSEHGLSPRRYRRVLRIDRLMRRLHPRPWEEDTFEGEPDFADQAHMIREFKALTGVTPGAYVRSKQRHNDPTLRSVIAEDVAPPTLD